MSLPSSVLLIDDDKTNNFLNERLLRLLAATSTVHTAESGQQALDWLGSASMPTPDLLLLDVSMPVMSGLEFLQRYRSQYPDHHPLIYVLTTTASSAELAPFALLDVADVLLKPLTREQLTAILAQHFPASPPSA